MSLEHAPRIEHALATFGRRPRFAPAKLERRPEHRRPLPRETEPHGQVVRRRPRQLCELSRGQSRERAAPQLAPRDRADELLVAHGPRAIREHPLVHRQHVGSRFGFGLPKRQQPELVSKPAESLRP